MPHDLNPGLVDEAGLHAPLGKVIAVTGAQAGLGIVRADAAGARLAATVGRFVGIRAGRSFIVAMVTEATAELPPGGRAQGFMASVTVDLMGEIRQGGDGASRFKRGITEYPAIGDDAVPLDAADLRLIYATDDAGLAAVGTLHQNESLPACIDIDGLVSKHFALLGTTGVGKSSGMAIILDAIVTQRPDLRVFLLDGHNEYGRCFGTRANVINSRTVKLPFWLFNFEELTDVIYGGRPAVAEEIEIFADVIPIAKSMYAQYKSVDRHLRRKGEIAGRSAYSIDTPVPYTIQDLVAQIDERMGRLENRGARMHYHRLMTRIETIRNDPHYAFMFENANVGGDTMGEILSTLFRLDPNGKPINVMQMAGLPPETMDAVVCVLCRLAFDFGLWSEGAVPKRRTATPRPTHRPASVLPAVR